MKDGWTDRQTNRGTASLLYRCMAASKKEGRKEDSKGERREKRENKEEGKKEGRKL